MSETLPLEPVDETAELPAVDPSPTDSESSPAGDPTDPRFDLAELAGIDDPASPIPHLPGEGDEHEAAVEALLSVDATNEEGEQEPTEVRINRTEWANLVDGTRNPETGKIEGGVRNGPGVTAQYFMDTLGYPAHVAVILLAEMQAQGIIRDKRNSVNLFEPVSAPEWITERVSEEKLALNALIASDKLTTKRRFGIIGGRLTKRSVDNALNKNPNAVTWTDINVDTLAPEEAKFLVFDDDAPQIERGPTLIERRAAEIAARSAEVAQKLADRRRRDSIDSETEDDNDGTSTGNHSTNRPRTGRPSNGPGRQTNGSTRPGQGGHHRKPPVGTGTPTVPSTPPQSA